MSDGTPRERLLERVLAFAVVEGIAGRSLREIANGAETSHRMLLYHFGSHEGLLAAIVAAMEQRQRSLMATLAEGARAPDELALAVWQVVRSAELRPFVRLFFEVLGLLARDDPGTTELRATLTEPWIEDVIALAGRLGLPEDPVGARLGVAVTRGLLLDLVAGADPAAVDAAYDRYRASML